MAEWPQLDELKQVLDVESDAWDGDGYDEEPTRLTALLAAAVDYVKDEVGNWDEAVDEPTVRQSRAALRMAELMALKPEPASLLGKDPTYQKYIRGSRRRFSVA